MHKVCVDALRGRDLNPLYCIAYVLNQSFELTTQPPVAGRETAGKMCHILNNNFAGQMPDIDMYLCKSYL